jgi:hypothetical protein
MTMMPADSRNRIMIYGPKNDGTYILEFRTGPPSKAGGPPSCPSDPLVPAAVPHQGAIYGPLHRGPISRPYPHREPVLIGVPLELLADPT